MSPKATQLPPVDGTSFSTPRGQEPPTSRPVERPKVKKSPSCRSLGCPCEYGGPCESTFENYQAFMVALKGWMDTPECAEWKEALNNRPAAKIQLEAHKESYAKVAALWREW